MFYLAARQIPAMTDFFFGFLGASSNLKSCLCPYVECKSNIHSVKYLALQLLNAPLHSSDSH